MSTWQNNSMKSVPRLFCINLSHPRRFLFWLAPILILLSIAAAPAQGFWYYPMEEPARESKKVENSPIDTAEETAKMFDHGIDELSRQLMTFLTDPDIRFNTPADGLAICSFVELKKLTRTSSFGRYLAEQLMTEFQQRGFPVNEIRKTNEILIQERRGEYGLSRDPESIRKRINSGTILTGTYTLTDHHVFVNARIIDAKSGTLLSSASTRLSRNNLLDTLLADRVSAETRRPQDIFMKRLEL